MSQPAELYETKSDFAYRQIRRRILSGELQPGQSLQQRELAHQIGISTTPLREALRRLMSEGLVELDAHRDAHITPLRAEEARDVLEVRRSLDPLAAGLAAERRTSSDLQLIRLTHEGLEPLPGHPAYEQLVAHRAFHRAIYCASHNDVLIEALDSVWDKTDRYRRLALQNDREQDERDEKANEHQLLVDCIASGDSEGAAELMRAHVETSLGAIAVRRLGPDHS